LLYGLSVELCEPPMSDASLAVTVRAGREATFAGPIVAAGRLEKSGPGTLRLTHDGTDLGDLTVNAGTVVLPGGGGVAGTLDVKSGATVATEHGTTYANPTMPMKDVTATIGTLTGAGTLRLDGKADIVSDRFSFVYVTNDASSGFSSEKTYTHLMDFGNGGATTVNGVTIPAYATSGGSHPAGAYVGGCMFSYFYDWSTQAGLVNYIANTEGVFNLYRDFTVFPGSGPWALRLYNLKAGRWHEFRWYQRAPVGGGLGTGRVSTYRFDPDGDGPQGVTVTIDQNSYKPHYLAYRFYAATTNCFTLSLYNHSSQNGAHIYGLSCEVIDDPTDAEPGVVSVEKGAFAGSIAGTNDWFKTGTNTLTLSGTSPFAGTAVVSGGTLLAQNAAFGAGSVRIDAGGAFGVTRGASASVGGNFTVSNGGTIRYEVEQGSQSGALAVAGETSLAATGTVDVVSTLSAQKLPSHSTLVVTQGTTVEPESYEGWQTILNGGDKFRGTLELDGKNLNLLCKRGLYIIFR
jgi:autotransporter-associated beta strand protein